MARSGNAKGGGKIVVAKAILKLGINQESKQLYAPGTRFSSGGYFILYLSGLTHRH